MIVVQAVIDHITDDPLVALILSVLTVLCLASAAWFARVIKKQLSEITPALRSADGRTVGAASDALTAEIAALRTEVHETHSELRSITARQERSDRWIGSVDDRVTGVAERVARVETSTARAHERIDRLPRTASRP